ncbi:MAG: metal ABC transporter permease [Phascolarctobacterium sp.]|nr:metal ABC transporter permease [Phascolarctobacterium sp.]
MLEIFEMGFMQRAWLAGLLMAITCPLIGSFLVLRRQSLIGDGLGHIAFAGVAGGALAGCSSVVSAAIATIIGALAIEKVRTKLSDLADMVLAIFFYSGMGLAVIFTGMNKEGGFNLSSVLFGSLMTVTSSDLWIVAGLAVATIAFVIVFYRPLQYLTFDETSAKVSGLPVESLSLLLAILTALTVALSMRIVGLLLVSAMMVIPVACALQTARSFSATIMQSIIYGIITVCLGLVLSYYLNLAPGGTIVLTSTVLFVLSLLIGSTKKNNPVPDVHCKVCDEDQENKCNHPEFPEYKKEKGYRGHHHGRKTIKE